MDIYNKTTGKLIVTKAQMAKSFKDRIMGLNENNPPSSFLFKTRFGIHTFGLKNPIDVLVLNDSYKVCKVKKNLKPNQILIWNPLHSLLLELPQNSIKDSNTKEGDQLLFEPEPKNW